MAEATKAGAHKLAQPERYDGQELHPDLAREQALAAEQEPKAVPLVRPKEDNDGPPAGPPTPPVAAATPAPRVVHQNFRAPPGLARWKIRCVNYPDQVGRYLLARTEEQARAEYVRATGLHAVLAAIGEGAPEPRLMVKKLPD